MKKLEDSVRKGTTQSRLNEEMANGFSAQVAICAALLGLSMKSWIVFGAAFLVPLLVYMLSDKVRWLRIPLFILCALYIVCWGYLGFRIGSTFSTEASIVLCIILSLSGAGYNLGALDYFRDL